MYMYIYIHNVYIYVILYTYILMYMYTLGFLKSGVPPKNGLFCFNELGIFGAHLL